MKILFLDIDGVILSGRALWATNDHTHLEAEAIKMLNEVCERTGALVVVSSTWRRDARCRSRLLDAGFTGRFHRDWRTPLPHEVAAKWRSRNRGGEIADWLSRHREVSRYAIIDDDSDMLPKQKRAFVQTVFADGITAAHVEQLVAILGEVETAEACQV